MTKDKGQRTKDKGPIWHIFCYIFLLRRELGPECVEFGRLTLHSVLPI